MVDHATMLESPVVDSFSMHDIARLLGSHQPRNIVVQTRIGSNIENYLGPEPSLQCATQFELLEKKHGRRWRRRKPITGGYNCAGLVWATRRACLPSPKDWEMILEDDGYRRLEEGEAPAVGDIVVYRAAADNEILHVSRVCGFDKLFIAGSEGREIPLALSKWGNTFGESVHRIRDIPPLNLLPPDQVLEMIYTDRPSPEN